MVRHNQHRAAKPVQGRAEEFFDTPAFERYRRLARVRQFVLANYARPVTLAHVAQIAGMEQTSFSRFFHKRVGVTFRYWLNCVRIIHAKQLLITTRDKVAIIAHTVGFEHPRTFEHQFRKLQGEAPHIFRERLLHARRCAG